MEGGSGAVAGGKFSGFSPAEAATVRWSLRAGWGRGLSTAVATGLLSCRASSSVVPSTALTRRVSVIRLGGSFV